MTHRNNSYERIDESRYVVSDSTLAYEALSKGKKTAIISVRGKFLNNNSFKFGPDLDDKILDE